MQQLASFCTDQTTHCANVKDASLEQEVLSYAPRCRMARYMHALHRVVFAAPAPTTALSA
jgi:hypothetical protein